MTCRDTDKHAQVIGCTSELIAFLLHEDPGAAVVQIHPPTLIQNQASPSCVHDHSLDNKSHTNQSPTTNTEWFKSCRHDQ